MIHTARRISRASPVHVLIVATAAAGGCDVAADARAQQTRPSATQKRTGELRRSTPAAVLTSQPPAPARSVATAPAVVPAGRRILRPDDFRGLAWRSVGPANMGGRVADIAVAPGNSKTFFVAYGTSGLWKTTNRGTTFSPVFDKEATASIGSVVVADAPDDWPGWKDEKPDESARPGSPEEEKNKGKGKIVWVGTGEGNGRNSSSWGTGVYRSTDGGATFKHVGLIDSHDIPRLAVDPRNPDVCYVAALGHLWGANKERGVYKTADGGRTWTAVLQIDENTGACDVLVNPQDPDTVYAAMYMRRRTAWSFKSGGPKGGIYRSKDAGATWTRLTTGLPEQTGRIGLDIWLKDPRVLYAVIESDVGGWGPEFWDNRLKAGGVFRSDDGGDSWNRVSPLNFRPFYFSKVRVDPTDDQRVYLLGWGLAVSDDGGRHFRAGGARLPHGDMHALVIDPTDRDHLIMGTDGGVYVSWDRARTWDFLNQCAVGEFYNVGVSMADPYHIGGGLQDNGTWVGPSATIMNSNPDDPGGAGGITNADWRLVNWGDGFHISFDPRDANVVYAESQGGELVRIHLDTGRRRKIKPSPKEGQARFRFNWNSPFFISPHNPDTLYFGGNFVFKLTNRGDYWEKISDDLSTRDPDKIMSVGSEAETHGTVVSLAESPLAAGMLWAGTDDGLVHVTTDDGRSWKNVTPPQVRGRYISRIEPSYHERDTAYVAIDGHRSDNFTPVLVMTTDAGRTWTDISGPADGDGSLASTGGNIVKVVREDRWNRNVLYVGTERGLFVTIDRGRRWVKMNGESLPMVAIDDAVQHPREGDLVLGTHGRSIWVLDGARPVSELAPDVLDKPLHLFSIQAAKPRYFFDYAGLWGDRIFKAANPPMGARITYWLREYTGEEVKVAITDSKGTTIRELTGPSRPGFNRVVWDLQAEKHDRFTDPDTGLGQTPFVPPGDYDVTVTLGKNTARGRVRVLPPPGTPADAAKTAPD